MAVKTCREINERRIKDTEVFPAGEVSPQTWKRWKLYMHPYTHGVQKKRTAYILQNRG